MKRDEIIASIVDMISRYEVDISPLWRSPLRVRLKVSSLPDIKVEGNMVYITGVVNSPTILKVYEDPEMVVLIKPDIGQKTFYPPFEWGEMAGDIIALDWTLPENSARYSKKEDSVKQVQQMDLLKDDDPVL